tara:strand:- start:249 stop:455 length:207 start_codon:yes stop_codon:yes gene_type:complete
MIIKNCVELDDGGYDFDFEVDKNEAAFLMDHAIKDLIRQGIIRVASEEEQFLAQAEVDDLIKDGGKLQ